MTGAVLDLFAGSGVGVAAHQIDITEYGVENMKEAAATRNVAGFLTPYSDVWDAHLAEPLCFDKLWASPPCQTFSVAGKGAGRKALDQVLTVLDKRAWTDIKKLRKWSNSMGDDRIGLVLSPLHYVYKYEPTYVAFEQVPTVLPVWEACAAKMRRMGYSVWVGYLHSEQYGVPQTRKRAYLIARKDGTRATPPPASHSKYYSHDPKRMDPGVKPWVSMAEALGWGIHSSPSPSLTSHLGVTRSPSGTQSVYRNAIERGRFTFKDVPPVPTKIATNGIGSEYAPNTVNIETQEGAVLQSYPYESEFPFQGSATKQHLQIGNAVPPFVAKAVLEGFLS